MPEFNRVAQPTISPTRCFICHDHAGPMIDTFIDDRESNGRIYICLPNDKRAGCVGQMARKAGYILPEEVGALEQHIDQLEAELEDLRTTSFTFSVDELGKVRQLQGNSSSGGAKVNVKDFIAGGE